MSAYVPNYSFQTDIPNGIARAIMKIIVLLVDLLVENSPEVYGKYVVCENIRKVLYVEFLRDLYVMLMAFLLCYNKFRINL